MNTVDLKNGLIAVAISLVMVSCGGNSATQQNAESSEQNDEISEQNDENNEQNDENSEQTEEQNGISYKLVKGGDYMFSGELFGLVEGQTYKIDLPAECISIVKQLDFDADGFPDVLMKDISACGGNGSLDYFFFVFYKGNGVFQATKKFGYTENDPLIEKWEDRTSVVVEVTNEGYNNEPKGVVKERYILKDGKAVLIESAKKKELAALKEIRNTEFSYDNPDEVKELHFDLDGDGKNDVIYCKFWERWGDVLVTSIVFSSGTVVDDVSLGCGRIGVLATKTKNVHDLVCGDDSVLHWDGKKYVE